MLPGIALGLGSYGYGTLSALLILYLQHDHLGGAQVALPVFALAFLTVRVLGSPMVDRRGGTAVALCSLLGEIAGLVTLTSVTSLGGALVATALTGASVALMYPAMVAITLARTGTRRAGMAVGTTTSFWDLGILTAGLVGGSIAQASGYQWAFASAAGAAFTGAVIVGALLRPASTRAERPIHVSGVGHSGNRS